MRSVFSGNVTFSILGACGEEYISALMQRGFVVKNVRSDGDMLYAAVSSHDYLRAARLSRSFGVRTRVCKREGGYFFLRRYRRRFGIPLGVIAAAALVIFLEQFVWKIEIHGNEKLSDNQVLKLLSENGVETGTYSPLIDVNELEINIKRRVPDIAWMSVSLNGSRLDVYIDEAAFPEEPEIPLNTPCNVVASKTGVVVDVQVYSGTLLYPKGSGVAEGSVIVSGAVDDGAGNISINHASAKIIAEFTEKVELFMPYTTVEKQRTGKIGQEKELMLFGFVIPFGEALSDKSSTICTEEVRLYDLFGMELPWKLKTNTYTEYEDITVTRKTDDIERILSRQMDDYCESVFGDYELVEIKKSVRADESGVYLRGDITLRGDIARQREIMMKNEN